VRNMAWESILKKPITVGATRIGMKPMPEEDEDCCKMVKRRLGARFSTISDDCTELFHNLMGAMQFLRMQVHNNKKSWLKKELDILLKISKDWGECEGVESSLALSKKIGYDFYDYGATWNFSFEETFGLK